MASVARDEQLSLAIEQIQASNDMFASAKAGRVRAIKMARAAGFTYADIAEQMGLTVSGVFRILKRAESDAA